MQGGIWMKSNQNNRCYLQTNYCKKKHSNDKKYLEDMIKSESEILKCMQHFLCDFLKDLEKIEPPEKRGKIAKEVICAYACKEKSIAELIKAITIKEKIDKPKRHKHTVCDELDVKKYLLIIIAILVIYKLRFWCNYNNRYSNIYC